MVSHSWPDEATADMSGRVSETKIFIMLLVWCFIWSAPKTVIIERGYCYRITKVKVRENKNRITLIILKSEIYFTLTGSIISLKKNSLKNIFQPNWPQIPTKFKYDWYGFLPWITTFFAKNFWIDIKVIWLEFYTLILAHCAVTKYCLGALFKVNCSQINIALFLKKKTYSISHHFFALPWVFKILLVCH